MTTREENLKKINEQLELLSDEQLEQVAGGVWSRSQLANDSRFLNVLLRGKSNQPERRGWFKTAPRYLIDVWKSLGIEIKGGSLFGEHSYNLDGKKISQAQAWAHAEKVIGKHLERKDWDW